MTDLDDFLRWHARKHRSRHLALDVVALVVIFGCCLILLWLTVWRPL